MLTFTYKNEYGAVTFYGSGSHSFMIKNYEGLSLVEKEYEILTYAGVDGQETISFRAMPRIITISVDITDKSARDMLRNAVKVLRHEGYLYITDDEFKRRIYCNQTTISEPEKILRGIIASFAVQFVCDNPYFEDEKEITLDLYGRVKNIITPFTLPRMFAISANKVPIENIGDKDIEPKIIININQMISDSYLEVVLNDKSVLTIENYSTGKHNNDKVTIDVKNRTIKSFKSGNLINKLSFNSFLENLILKPGKNYIEINTKDVTDNITAQCVYVNLYSEAIII